MSAGTGRLPSAGPLRALTFVVAETTYAIPVGRVREVVPLAPPTVGTGPASDGGTLAYRGAAVPLVDLLGRLGGPAALPAGALALVVEVRSIGGGIRFGIVADAVGGVVEVPAAKVMPMPARGSDAELGCARGDRRDEIAVVIDVDVTAATRLPRELRGELPQ